jgi:hypothetical protein
MAPLAPVVATVRFFGGEGKGLLELGVEDREGE